MVFQRYIKSIRGLAGFQPKLARRAPDIVTNLSYVAAGYGISVVSQDMKRCGLPNVVFKDIAWDCKVEANVDFLYRSAETSPVVKQFISAMRRHSLEEQDRRRPRIAALKKTA
jgi:DNA-binding transcriptional LysR family regulator